MQQATEFFTGQQLDFIRVKFEEALKLDPRNAQAYAQEGETAVAFGNILGVQAVVVGTLSQPALTLEADARILNVATGEALAACFATSNSAAQLRQMAETLAKEIVTKAVLVHNAVRKDSTQSKP